MGIEPTTLAWKAKVIPFYDTRINNFMSIIDPEESYLLLQKLVEGKPPYLPTTSWTNSRTFVPDKILSMPRPEFVPDTIINFVKPNFVRDTTLDLKQLVYRDGFEPS